VPGMGASLPPSAASGGGQARGLKANALMMRDVVVMALASSGPTQSVAVSIAAIVAASGYAGVLPVFVCLVPMLGIAIGYRRLNAWQPSAGATYSWVGRALNPYAGFFAGWIMLLYYTVGTVSLTIPLGTYLLSLFSSTLPGNTTAVLIAGAALNLAVLVVAALGIELSARFQWAWAVFEYLLLIGFGVLALVDIYAGHLAGAVHVRSSWFTLAGAGGMHGLIAGLLIAIFLYSGWDTAAYVGEETRQRKAGNAAITSVIILFVIYAFSVFAFQGAVPGHQLQANAGNILAYIAARLAGHVWGKLMVVAVLGGTLASLQAAIVSASRISFAMGRDRAFPGWFSRIHPRWRTPWNATILLGLLNVVFLWASLKIGPIGTALSDIVSTLGLYAAIFYALTAAAALWFYRRVIASGASNLLLGGVLPAIGAAFMVFVIVYSLATHALTPVEIWSGFGLAVFGLVLALVSRLVGRSEFFRQRPETAVAPGPEAAAAPAARPGPQP
jgi:amino acid transporter